MTEDTPELILDPEFTEHMLGLQDSLLVLIKDEPDIYAQNIQTLTQAWLGLKQLETTESQIEPELIRDMSKKDTTRLARALKRIITTTEAAVVKTAELTKESIRDTLTGLYNRRYFLEKLDQAVKTTEETGKPFAIAFVDLDDLKIINDYFGHEVGDIALQRVADVLKNSVRSEKDTPARLGGDEFTLLIENLDEKDSTSTTTTIAERITSKLEHAHQLRESGSEIKTRVSIGIAIFEPGMTAKEILMLADAAMYVAKKDPDKQFHTHPTYPISNLDRQ